MELENYKKKSIEIAGRELTVETGRMAKQANGSIFLTYGETALLITVTANKEAAEDQSFFPLNVDFQEKMFAAGKIPGGFFKREAKPSVKATLNARLIDRAIRPLFPEGFRNSVHVVITVLSYDEINDPALTALLGTSLALSISDIPFNGPIASVNVGIIDDELIINPTVQQLENSSLDLAVAGSESSIVMVEAGALEISENQMMEALYTGHSEIIRLIEFQKDFISGQEVSKMDFTPDLVDQDILKKVTTGFEDDIKNAINIKEKAQRSEMLDQLKDKVIEKYSADYNEDEFSELERSYHKAYDELVYNLFRRSILDFNKRADGRSLDDIRPIACEIDILPRVHGSALFTRGETQALGSVTLGSTTDEQIVDGLEEEFKKNYFLHYNFPPFSVGEAGFLRPPGRRELGHGALAERAISAIMPTKDEFPYTVRIVSDILESNGSSSMATVCSGVLALMSAGVPIKGIVAGIANGLIMEGDKYAVLTDIMGLEDHLGDMDFKVTGTEKGITAIQMDIKIDGISREIMQIALEKAKNARLFIIEKIKNTISQPKESLSVYAPKIQTLKIDTDKIGAVIGPSGKMIKSIIEETKVSIDINDDGTVTIASTSQEDIDKAVSMIKGIADEPVVNEIYDGVVSRIEPFGAFVKFMGNYKEGLVHISQLHKARIEKVEDILKIGDQVKVRYTGSDRGKIQLTMKGVKGNEFIVVPPPSANNRSFSDNERSREKTYDRDRDSRSRSRNYSGSSSRERRDGRDRDNRDRDNRDRDNRDRSRSGSDYKNRKKR